jgi:hypothetical protein
VLIDLIRLPKLKQDEVMMFSRALVWSDKRYILCLHKHHKQWNTWIHLYTLVYGWLMTCSDPVINLITTGILEPNHTLVLSLVMIVYRQLLVGFRPKPNFFHC